jgi:hypothetical protein
MAKTKVLKSRFTPGQTKVLRLLGIHSATDRDHGHTIPAPSAAVYLIDGYFVQKRTVKPKGGSQTTVYWLTERGQRALASLPDDGPVCKGCGCTENNACVGRGQAGPCHWYRHGSTGHFCSAPTCTAASDGR